MTTKTLSRVMMAPRKSLKLILSNNKNEAFRPQKNLTVGFKKSTLFNYSEEKPVEPKFPSLLQDPDYFEIIREPIKPLLIEE
jgi:hypothetical protein